MDQGMERNPVSLSNVKLFKDITKSIENQLQDPSHPIANVIAAFKDYFYSKYDDNSSKPQNPQVEKSNSYEEIDIGSFDQIYSFQSNLPEPAEEEKKSFLSPQVYLKKIGSIENDLKSFLSFLYVLLGDYYQLDEVNQLP